MESQILIPDAPSGFSADSLFQGINWHQRWEVFPGVFVPGRNDVNFLCDAVQLPSNLQGLRVLDVGAWHGCVSFECERRGAKEVIALSLEDPELHGFNRLKHVLGSKVEYVRGSVYNLSPDVLGKFDVVIFFGVLYHLRYPLLAIDRLRGISDSKLFIETHVIDNYPWLRGPMGSFIRKMPWVKSVLQNTPVWRQYEAFELAANDQSNWFGPNIIAVLESFQSAGFDINHIMSWGDRASFQAKVGPVPKRILQYTYESVYSNRDLVRLHSVDSYK